MENYIGRSVKMKKTSKDGVIINYQYNSDVNHYFFKIKIDNSEIITFDENDFILI